MTKKLNKIHKYMHQRYWKDKQNLNLETWEMFLHDPKEETDNCSFDIHIHDHPIGIM